MEYIIYECFDGSLVAGIIGAFSLALMGLVIGNSRLKQEEKQNKNSLGYFIGLTVVYFIIYWVIILDNDCGGNFVCLTGFLGRLYVGITIFYFIFLIASGSLLLFLNDRS